MTKFCLVSDLHLGFGSVNIDNTENADCLIMAGDIYEFANIHPKSELSYSMIDEFFKHVSDQFKQVIYVAGNHEYYGFRIDKAKDKINDYFESMNIGNIKFINNETVKVNDINVHGATLWTNFNNGDSLAMKNAQWGMNDYRYISKNSNEVFTPQIAFDEHVKSMEFFRNAVSDKQKCVIVSHHAPLYKCISPDHSHDTLDHAYASNLSEFICDNPNIKAWCFGHVHERFDFMCCETRVLSNCRGYNRHERIAQTFKPFFFEV